MPRKPSQEQYILSQERSQTIFEKIKRNSLKGSSTYQNLRAIFLGGQSGSGKSSLAQYLSESINQKEGSVIINSDALREYHPDFPSLQKNHVDQASFLVNPDTVKWQQQLIAATIDTKRNLILDGTLGGNPDLIRTTMRMLCDAGYAIQLSILAVPARLSRLGIYKRYEDQVELKGTGRWVGMENHDRLYDEIPRTLALLESEKAVDQIQLFGRPTGLSPPPLLYDNRLINGNWEKPSMVVEALDEKRNRAWTADEQTAFRQAAQSVSEQMRQRGALPAKIAAFFGHVDLPMLIHRPAQPADSQLYFDWANDPDTRRQSFNSDPISWEMHMAWFTRKLADPNALLLIFENEAGEPVGQVRFERTSVADQADELIIGVSVDKRQRGKGLSSQLIGLGCAVCREQWGTVTIHAYIKPDNQASVRTFERAGFKLSGESGKFGVPSLVYILKA